MSLFNELKRRNVFRVGLAYLVSAWVIAQVADLVLDNIDAPPWVMQTLLLGLGLGFIIALIISWAYELTPEGIKKEKDVVRDNSITNMTAKKLDYITLAGVVLVVALFAYQRVNPVPSMASTSESVSIATNNAAVAVNSPTIINEVVAVLTETNSIAVLPFVNMSSDAEQEYFADGISEEILNALVKATGLRVAGRTSSFSFKGKDDTIKEIGEALNVAHVLEGSVRKQGNKVRITAQLIKAEDEFHLWSETYDGSLDNIFDLQENISRQVTDELKVILDLNADERLANKMTDNINAYDLFLKGREAVGNRLGDNLKNGMDLLNQAVELDPDFAMAWAVLAEAEVVSPGYLPLTQEASLAANNRAMKYAHKAIELDAKLALPHGVLGLVSLDNKDIIRSIEELKLALNLEPNNALATRWLGNSYNVLGINELAMPLYEKAYELDPLSSINTYNLASNHFKMNNPDEAIRFFRITGELRDNYLMPQISFIYEHLGNHAAAKNWMRDSRNEAISQGDTNLITDADFEILIKGLFGGSKTEKEASLKLGTFFYKGPNDQHVFQLEFHLALGNIDKVYEILNEKPSFFSTFAADYMWLPSQGTKAFRADPRFIQLMIKHNLPQAWQVIGWPEYCQPNAGTDGSKGEFKCQ